MIAALADSNNTRFKSVILITFDGQINLKKTFYYLQMTKIKVVSVKKELREVVELRDQFLDIIDVVVEVLPSLWHRMELTISYVKATALQFDVQRREGFHAHQVVEDHRGVGVVRAVVKLGHRATRIFKLLVLGFNFADVLRILNSDRFGQIAKAFGVVQVQDVGGVIREDPWKDRVLREVVERASGNSVQAHKVLEVGDVSVNPLLC
jgi:hypothetical protein